MIRLSNCATQLGILSFRTRNYTNKSSAIMQMIKVLLIRTNKKLNVI